MPDYDELEDALTLVHKCTIAQIKSLLRLSRHNDYVRLSAATKKDLIQKNLREALHAGAVKLEAVFKLIQESEENGDQHIWYHRIPPRLSSQLEFEAMAQALLGNSWQKKVAAFPSLRLKPSGYVVGDFRKSDKKPTDWTLKIYGQETINEPVGGLQKKENGSLWQEYRPINLRSVLVVRRNGLDLLEIRIQRNSSKRRVDEWLKTAWSFLQPALLRQQLPEWQLPTAINQLIVKCEQNPKLYNFRDAGIFDEQNEILAEYQTLSDQGNLLASQNVLQSLQDGIEKGHKVRKIAVNWLSEKTSLESDLRVLLGVRGQNEMLVQSHCSSADLDYVTDQLRRFMKA